MTLMHIISIPLRHRSNLTKWDPALMNYLKYKLVGLAINDTIKHGPLAYGY